MESEGPYMLECRDYDRPYIYGPSLPENGWSPFEWRFLNTCDKLNSAYAEGVKAERERCAKILSTVKNAELLIKSLFPDEIGGQDAK